MPSARAYYQLWAPETPNKGIGATPLLADLMSIRPCGTHTSKRRSAAARRHPDGIHQMPDEGMRAARTGRTARTQRECGATGGCPAPSCATTAFIRQAGEAERCRGCTLAARDARGATLSSAKPCLDLAEISLTDESVRAIRAYLQSDRPLRRNSSFGRLSAAHSESIVAARAQLTDQRGVTMPRSWRANVT